ncbi:MAG: MutS family DNA mismatch repair protein [Myxococcota bacterium]|nr:MutS family DNA mismatch repair protein [Myxococcota bacterium]
MKIHQEHIEESGPPAGSAAREPTAGQARDTYERGREARAGEVASLDARANFIATARLSLAGVALVLVGGIVWARLGAWAWMALGAIAIAFVLLVFVHARVHQARERAAAGLRFHERGLARLAHDWDHLPMTSARFGSRDHPFTADLDVFGRASLMQLVDVTETRFGEERLASLLSLESPGAWPDDVMARQLAVRDLAARFIFREALSTAGGVLADEKPDPSPILRWAEAHGRLAQLMGWLSWGLPAIALGAMAFGPALHVRAGIVTALVIAELALGIAIGARLTPMLEAVSARESAVTRWRAMITAVEGEAFEAPLLIRLREGLVQKRRRASEELASLERIVGFVDARRNEVFRFFIGPLLMWDVHCAAALLRWRAQSGDRVRGWLDALGEVEALASLAAFAFDHADFAWPEPAKEPRLEASALAHPLIPADKRVGNDVRLPSGGRALIVTGSNMSGKSTLLRAIGANAVLAFAGAPVCARSLLIGPARVATSMRIEDSLEQGVSHFYGELQRLKHVLDLARGADGGAVLFLLDEILHGTNSRERVIGARAVVRELIARGALGAVSTHDLGITVLEAEAGGRVENAHFEEQVEGDEMTFDYILRSGVVQSSNALRLMRAIGIDVNEI